MTLILTLLLPSIAASKHVYFNKHNMPVFFLILCDIVQLVFYTVFPAEDTGGPGRQTMNEREAFDARNILKVRQNLPLPKLQIHRLVFTP